jgi:hypothetical protein
MDTDKIKCPNCVNGWREGHEDGRPVRDACYTCGNTGKVDPEQFEQLRMREACDVLALNIVSQKKKSMNSNPDGEGFGFAAAENMLSEYDYFQSLCMDESGNVSQIFEKMMNEGNGHVARAIVNFVVPKKSEPNAEYIDGTSGQDRKSYSDTQDRSDYQSDDDQPFDINDAGPPMTADFSHADIVDMRQRDEAIQESRERSPRRQRPQVDKASIRDDIPF